MIGIDEAIELTQKSIREKEENIVEKTKKEISQAIKTRACRGNNYTIVCIAQDIYVTQNVKDKLVDFLSAYGYKDIEFRNTKDVCNIIELEIRW